MTVVERFSRINGEKKPPFLAEWRPSNSNANLEFVRLHYIRSRLNLLDLHNEGLLIQIK
jgi:hypothetical protein